MIETNSPGLTWILAFGDRLDRAFERVVAQAEIGRPRYGLSSGRLLGHIHARPHGITRLADAADHGARAEAEHADADHAERDVGVLHQRIGLPGEIADAELAGDHLGRDQRHPGDAHADGEAGEDVRQRGGKIDLAEDRRFARTEALRRAHQHRIDHRHAVQRVEQDREERAEEGDEDDALFVRTATA